MVSSPLGSSGRKGMLSTNLPTTLRYPSSTKGSTTGNNNPLVISILLCSGLLFLNLLLMVLVLNFQSFQTPTTTTLSTNEFQNTGNSLSSSSAINSNTNNNINSSELRMLLKSRDYRKHQQCKTVYQNIKRNQTVGLTDHDYTMSRTYYGNQRRIRTFVQTLQQRQKPVSVIVCGGSITLGHGVEPETLRYSNILEDWLNVQFPMNNSTKTNDKKANKKKINLNEHTVYNKGAHGADICAMSKRLNTIIIPENPDLFILEFAVNDYQGQDHKVHIDHKTDVFFDGFQRIALCTEIVVHHLLTKYPNAAIIFLEFQTAILNRKTAQLLHMGVAQHYHIPIISYANTMFPPFYNLIQKLDPSKSYTTPVGNTQLPYPHGCSPCLDQFIDVAFRPYGCKSICVFMSRSGYSCDPNEPPPAGYDYCYTSFLAHDAVHPSAVGHQIARDLIIELIAVTAKDLCLAGNTNVKEHYIDQFIPGEPKFLASTDLIHQQSNFIIVKDTMQMFGEIFLLKSSNNSAGFKLIGDGMADRIGWVTTGSNEFVEYDIDLPTQQCYVIYIAALKSYEKMGKFRVDIIDLSKSKTTITRTLEVDGIWEPKISIPADIQINSDDGMDDLLHAAACTGHCRVRITSLPPVPGRTGVQKVKIMTLSVRKCLPPKQPKSNSNLPSMEWIRL